MHCGCRFFIVFFWVALVNSMKCNGTVRFPYLNLVSGNRQDLDVFGHFWLSVGGLDDVLTDFDSAIVQGMDLELSLERDSCRTLRFRESPDEQPAVVVAAFRGRWAVQLGFAIVQKQLVKAVDFLDDIVEVQLEVLHDLFEIVLVVDVDEGQQLARWGVVCGTGVECLGHDGCGCRLDRDCKCVGG